MFIQESLPEPAFKLSRKNIDGKRWYLIDGTEERFPSITTVLSCRGTKWLHEWRAAVGFDEANRVARKASTGGTAFHKACENFLCNKEPFELTKKVKFYDPITIARFRKFSEVLKEKVGKVYAQELQMVSRKIEVAGTVDLIAEWDGSIAVIDFKTSRRPKDIDNIKGYFTQATAYSIMLYEMYGIVAGKLVIAISVEDGSVQIFEGKPSDHIEYLIESREMYRRGLKD